MCKAIVQESKAFLNPNNLEFAICYYAQKSLKYKLSKKIISYAIITI